MSTPGEIPVPAKGPSKGKIIAIAAVLVVLACGGVLWWLLSASSDAAEVGTGDCAIVDDTVQKADCSSDRAAKVVKVIQGQADESLCPRGVNASVYPDPPLTQCIEPVKR